MMRFCVTAEPIQSLACVKAVAPLSLPSCVHQPPAPPSLPSCVHQPPAVVFIPPDGNDV